MMSVDSNCEVTKFLSGDGQEGGIFFIKRKEFNVLLEVE